MGIDERQEIIELCIKSASLVIEAHDSVMKALAPAYNNDFSGTIADEITDQLYKIIKMTAVTWPKEYDELNSYIPFGLLYGNIKSDQIKNEFFTKVLGPR